MRVTQQANLAGYDLPAIAWKPVRDALATDYPQAPGSGPATRKSRNIAANPRCVVSIATQPFDLVIEGSAERVTEGGELDSVAAIFVKHGWPARVDGDALTAEFSAPSAGPPPWHVYRIEPDTVYAFGTAEPGGATKFGVTGE